MSVVSTLRAGQLAAEARMLTTVAIQTVTGTTSDPNTGSDVPTYATSFTTVARVSVGRGLAVRGAEVGGRTAAEVVRELQIPVSSPVIPAGASALVTAVHATDDPTLLGARLILSGSAPGSQTTARRLEVTEIVS